MAYKVKSPIPISEGGTGDQTFTTYAPVCGGTASTNPLQSASTGQATSGFILTSTGNASLPTFQAPAASSITITGNSGGGLTGNSFTFTGGTTGLTFAGAGTTETLGGTLAIANGGTNATSFTQSNGIATYNGTSLVNYAGPQISSGGIYTNSTQPAFLAYVGSSTTNATGDGTNYQIGSTTAYTKIYDRGTNFNTNGVFTAPVTGVYMFTAGYAVTNVGVAHTRLLYYGSATSRQATVSQLNPFIVLSSNGFLILTASFYLDMSSGDTISMNIIVYNSTKTVTIYGDASLNTFFGGSLIC